MKVWFMFDNHTFEFVGDGTTSRDAMEAKARKLFDGDDCGSLFARDDRNHRIAQLHAVHQQSGKCDVTDDALDAFFDRVEEYSDWVARG